MLLDAHAHLFHPSWYPATFLDQLLSTLPAGASARAGTGRVLLRALSDDSGEATVRAMDRAAIDRRVVLVVDWGLELGEAEQPIEDVHRAILGICARFPDRLVGYAGVDPRRPQAARLLAWAIDELGARGLKLHPTSPTWSLADEATLRLVEVAAKRGLPVLVHVGSTFSPLSDRHATPAAVVQLARAFPQTTVVAGHAGFARWREFSGLGDAPPNLLLDVSAWQSRGSENGVLEQDLGDMLRCFSGRVVFGTDSPFFGLPGTDADARWISRLREVLRATEGADEASFFAHPRLVREGTS